MDICGLPISFLGTGGNVNILLTAVGVKLPTAFQICYQSILTHTQKIELDVSSIASECLPINGRVTFNISVCESSDALSFLLGLSDPSLPHLNYHVIVGAAVAESQADLISYANEFDTMVRQSASSSIPCLFVFSSKFFKGEGLPQSAIQIPSDSDTNDVSRRVKEGFIRCLMEYLMGLRQTCDDLFQKSEDGSSLVQLASCAFLLGGRDKSVEFFQQSLKFKGISDVVAVAVEQSKDKILNFDVDKSILEKDVPQQFSFLEKDVPPEYLTAISFASKCKDKIILVRLLLRLSLKLPQFSRPLLLNAISRCLNHHRIQFTYYLQLSLLLLKHCGLPRTFLFQTYQYITSQQKTPRFILRPFVETLTSASDWCEQRIQPASMLFSSETVPRELKNNLIQYLLNHLHVIRVAERQKQLLDMIPSNLKVEAKTIINIVSFEPQIPLSPIEKASPTKSSQGFIYSPLTKRKVEKICAVGDRLCFLITLSNPLMIPLNFDMLEISADNAITTPSVYTIGPHRSLQISLVAQAKSIGKMKVNGFTFVSGNIIGVYTLEQPIEFEVIEKLPTVVVRLPFKAQSSLVENSYESLSFEIINSSDAAVDIKGLRFAPVPPVFNSTSLPIEYPPLASPPLPNTLNPGSSHAFSLRFLADKTLSVISFAIEYGSEKYSRSFEFNQEYTITEGPHISRLQVVTLDDHDDFLSVGLVLMIVIKNPFDVPITITCEAVEPIIIPSKSFGTLIVGVDRINADIDPSLKKFSADGLDSEHIRKCETAAIRQLTRNLTIEEKRKLWSTLLLKKKIQEQLNPKWATQNGLEGLLPMTHVDIDDSAFILLQKPPFSVEFSIERTMEQIWELTCKTESKEKIKMKAVLSFDVEKTGNVNNKVFTAGSEVNEIEAPSKFVTAINCLPIGVLNVTGKFFIGEAYFVRKASFILSR